MEIFINFKGTNQTKIEEALYRRKFQEQLCTDFCLNLGMYLVGENVGQFEIEVTIGKETAKITDNQARTERMKAKGIMQDVKTLVAGDGLNAGALIGLAQKMAASPEPARPPQTTNKDKRRLKKQKRKARGQ